MDDSHAAHGSQLQGYRCCSNEWCGAWVLEEVAQRTRGFCSDCYRKLIAPSITAVEVRNRGRRMTTPVRMKSRPEKNKGDRTRSKLGEKANDRARKRLAMMFPDLYDLLRAEERDRVGLDPWPVETVIEAPEGPDSETALQFAKVLQELADADLEV